MRKTSFADLDSRKLPEGNSTGEPTLTGGFEEHRGWIESSDGPQRRIGTKRAGPVPFSDLETVFTLAYDRRRHTYILIRRVKGNCEREILDEDTARFIIQRIQKRRPNGEMYPGTMRVGQSLPLNPKEVLVLQAVAEGLTNRAIALRLRITENTTKRHLQSIFAKLGVASRTQAAMLALSRGWISNGKISVGK